MDLMRFLRDRSGSIAPIIAGAAIPIVSLTGAAVDYSRANSLKASIQSALDSTALAMTKNAMSGSPEQFTTDANAYFNALFKRTDTQGLKVDAKYTSVPNPTIVVTASASIKTMFLNLPGIGIPKIDVAASATTSWSNARLRVALALDNTGSMADNGKMTALKTATHNLLNQLQSAASNPEDVYVSIIPFSKDVNTGVPHTTPWIDFTEWDKKNGKWVNGAWVSKSHDNWNGCAMDRDQNYDVNNAAPVAGNNASKFPAEQYASCPVAMIPMTADWTALHARVDLMHPAGNTNQTIGLQWAWQSLTQTDPLNAPAKDPNYQYKDIIILLTDGLNTENRWSQTASSVDKRTQKACDNIRTAEITLYTVLVMAGNATLLQGCATDQTKYFALTSADQLITTFNTIGGQLAKLHLAK
jgi:Flp pilus assembly protein TadG